MPFYQVLFSKKTAFRTHSQSPSGMGCSSMPRPPKEAAAGSSDRRSHNSRFPVHKTYPSCPAYAGYAESRHL